MKISLYHIAIILMGLFLIGCAGTKRLPEGKKLYTGSKLSFETKSIRDYKKIKKSLKELIEPRPNTSVLGLRPRLWIYNRVGEVKKDKGFKHWLKYEIGQPPVTMDQVNVDYLTGQLEYRLVNKGFFNGNVSSSVKIEKKKASVVYQVDPGGAYLVGKVVYPDSSNLLNRIIAFQKKKSRIRKGHRFDLDELISERKRLEKVVQDSGYYHMSHRMLVFDADSTTGDHEVDLFLRKKENIPPRAMDRYKISKIQILPGYTRELDTLGSPISIDSIEYYLNTHEIRARPVANAIKLRTGNYYSKEDEEITLNRLSGMGVFRYINLNYEEDTVRRYLRARINLVPYKRKSIRFQLDAVSKSNNFVGPFFTFSFMNRNFLGGGERLQISLNSGFEAQINPNQGGPVNSYELGLHTSLTVPRLIIPFHVNEADSKYDFETEYNIGLRSQKRVGYFNLMSLDLSMGYHWNKKVIHRYEFLPVNVNFFKLTNTTEKFRNLLENSQFLQNTFQEQFILGGRFSYYYNSKALNDQFHDANNFYFNGNLNTSGNIVNWLQQAFTKSPEGKDSQPLKIGGLTYAQFAKVDFDFRYYRRLDSRNRLATRIIAGLGYPYGNSNNLPYSHQFSVGGSSSIRAFRPRSVGPGEYVVPDSVAQNNVYIDQTADIKLEWNLEYRFDIYKNLKGAVFLDAGNIWSLKIDEERPGAQFRFNRFYKEIAMGGGIGIRYDVKVLILRLDVATPIRIPYGPESDRWVINKVAIDKKSWRQQNLIFNIAIGYPF